MKSMLINFLGLTASVISFILWLPQARVTWLSRKDPEKLRGISIGTQLLVMLNATIWAVYAVLANSLWVGVPGLVNFPLALITVIIVLKATRTRDTQTITA